MVSTPLLPLEEKQPHSIIEIPQTESQDAVESPEAILFGDDDLRDHPPGDSELNFVLLPVPGPEEQKLEDFSRQHQAGAPSIHRRERVRRLWRHVFRSSLQQNKVFPVPHLLSPVSSPSVSHRFLSVSPLFPTTEDMHDPRRRVRSPSFSRSTDTQIPRSMIGRRTGAPSGRFPPKFLLMSVLDYDSSLVSERPSYNDSTGGRFPQPIISLMIPLFFFWPSHPNNPILSSFFFFLFFSGNRSSASWKFQTL